MIKMGGKEQTMKLLIGMAIAAGIAAAIGAGFHTEYHSEYQIGQSGKAYVVANYSETECWTAVDDLGDLETRCDTDYWSETVSETWYFNTLNNQFSVPTKALHKNGQIYQISGFPGVSLPHTKRHFDGYSNKLENNFTLYVNNSEYSLNQKEYQTILDKRKDTVEVEYWYSTVTGVK